MNIYAIVILNASVTGLAIIIGSLVMIYRGTVKLAGGGQASTTFSFGKLLTVATNVAGLGLFVIGLAFELVAMYGANQMYNTPGQISAAVSRAVAQQRDASTLHLRGLIHVASDQDAVLSVCLGQNLDVPSNNPFDETIGPDFDFFVVKLTSPGTLPQYWTVTRDGSGTYSGYTRMVVPHDGIGNLGEIKLDEVVDLTPAVSASRLSVANLPAPIPANNAYGAQP